MASPYGTTNGSYGGQEQQNTAAVGSQYAENDSSAEKQSSVDKDQVGWYFVERYYSILSEKSDQLHVSRSYGASMVIYMTFTDSGSFSTTKSPSSYTARKLRFSLSWLVVL